MRTVVSIPWVWWLPLAKSGLGAWLKKGRWFSSVGVLWFPARRKGWGWMGVGGRAGNRATLAPRGAGLKITVRYAQHHSMISRCQNTDLLGRQSHLAGKASQALEIRHLGKPGGQIPTHPPPLSAPK